MKEEVIIALSDVSKVFQTKERVYPALKNINLTIHKGEYMAIAGKSGSGKSTLLNMITGIDHPTNGRIWVNGTDISQMNESRLASWRGKNIGIVFQFFQLIPTLTIRENILLAMELTGHIAPSDREQRADGLLRQVGLADHAGKMPAALSGGEQQRAAIARALANDPPIIVADEPTGNLDSKTAASIHLLFKTLSEEGKTVIIVTHEQDAALRYRRMVTLADGEIEIPTTEKSAL